MSNIDKSWLEGVELPKLGQVSTGRSTYTRILPNGEREIVKLEKGDQQRKIRSWPKKLGKHASKERFTNHPGVSEIALQEVLRDEIYQELTQFIKNLKIEVEE